MTIQWHHLTSSLEGLRRRAATTSELTAIDARLAALNAAGAAYDAAFAARVVLYTERAAELPVIAAYERAPRVLTDTLAALIAGAAAISYTPSPAWTLTDATSLHAYAALLIAQPGAATNAFIQEVIATRLPEVDQAHAWVTSARVPFYVRTDVYSEVPAAITATLQAAVTSAQTLIAYLERRALVT